MKARLQNRRDLPALLLLLMLTACGSGGGSGGGTPPTMFNVGGYVGGLVGSGLSLSNNGGTAVAVSRNGAFSVGQGVPTGTMYNVAIATQPTNPAQTCTISNGSGAVGNANVTSINVQCPQAVGTFAYVGIQGNGDVCPNVPGSLSAYSIDKTTGALTAVPGATVTTGPSVVQLWPVPQSSFLWALNYGDGTQIVALCAYISNIYAYTVDSASGALTPVSGSPFATLNGDVNTPSACGLSGYGTTWTLIFYPTGQFGYVANQGTIAAQNSGTWPFTIDNVTGAPTALGTFVTGACGGAITIDASGQFAYTSPNASFFSTGKGLFAYTIDSSTGALTQTQTVSSTIPVSGPVATDPFGRFVYARDGGLIYGFTIDSSSGALTTMAGSPFSFPSWASAMAITPNGQFAYVSGLDGVYTYAIAPGTGVLTAVGNPITLQLQLGENNRLSTTLQLDPSGEFLYVSATVAAGQQGIFAYAVDANTGALTLVPGSPFAVSSQDSALVFGITN